MALPPVPKSSEAPVHHWWNSIVGWFDSFLDLREGMDREGASESIRQGKFMRGSNAWMLVCSIMIASLGLNLNSGAVIIGAMLISPLMNPILGLGLGVATNDRETLFAALRHFFIAIMIALVTSTLFFLLTPISQFTQEMAARTAPTILDGMVAIFGGLAGIISVTRADKTNAIPGVAIATALMPPLCVTGYGIAVGDWNVAARSFYLFFLNSFFIAAMAYIIIRLLRFPYRKYVNKREARLSRVLIGLFSLIIIIPGFIILREVVKDLRYKRGVDQFVQREFGSSIAEYKILPIGEDSSLLIMELLNREIPADSLEYYRAILRSAPYGIERVGIVAIPDYSLSVGRLSQLQGQQVNSLDNLNSRIEALQEGRIEVAQRNQRLESELISYRLDTVSFRRLGEQVCLAFPSVKEVNVARVQSFHDSTFVDGLPLVVLRRINLRNRREDLDERTRLEKYLKATLAVDTLEVIYTGI